MSNDFKLLDYELTDKYHDNKEKMAWLASTLYFTFSIIIINWIIDYDDYNKSCSLKIFVITILSLIFLCTLVFVIIQFYYKKFSRDKNFKLKLNFINDNNSKLHLVIENRKNVSKQILNIIEKK